jgi:hypothetical protein
MNKLPASLAFLDHITIMMRTLERFEIFASRSLVTEAISIFSSFWLQHYLIQSVSRLMSLKALEL